MLSGFKDFLMRGNVVELAVGVIIGSAFTAIVTSVTDSIIQPIINSFGSVDSNGLGFTIRSGNEATFVDFGAVITAAINFLIVASVVYFLIILPMNKLDEINKRRKGVDPEAAGPTSEELLVEIRDLLATNNGGPATGTTGTSGSQVGPTQS